MTEQRRYSDFDLVIEGSADEGYRARVLGSPVGQATGAFTLPFSDLELENFLLKVGRPRGTTRRLESSEMKATRKFGSQLYDAVFQDDLRLSLRRSIDETERKGEGLRIRLRFTDTPELAALPWEYLFSESNDEFLVLSTWTPIVRYLDLSASIEPLLVHGPLRILAMISSPRDYPTLDIDEEWHRVESALAPQVESGAVMIDRVDDATLGALSQKLLQNEYHIFHFLGHGGYDESADDGVLVLEDGQNRSRIVSGRDIGVILHDHRSLRLAVLNACEGARAGGSDPFAGSAQSLVRKGIPAVVAMQFEITDDAAIAFAQSFYGAIAYGLPVDAAVAEARKAIFSLDNDIEWGTPVLYLRGDGQLFEVPEGEDRAAVVPLIIYEDHDQERGIEVDDESTVPVVDVSKEDEEPDAEDDGGPVDGEDDDSDEAPLAALLALLTQRFAGLPVWGWALGVIGLVIIIAILWPDPEPDGGGDVTTTIDTTSTTATTVAPDALAPDGTASAARAEFPITVDGFRINWPETAIHTTDHIIYTNDAILNGSVARAGTENESRIWLAWDDTFLYIYAEVDDDVMSVPNTGNQIWRNDAVNLNISVLDSSGAISERPDGDDYQLTLSPREQSTTNPGQSVLFVGDGSAFRENVTGIADVESIYGEAGNYGLEAAFAWEHIGVVDPQPGLELGMLVAVFDNDGEEVGGDTIQSEIKANTSGAVFQSPQSWGTFTLVRDGTVETTLPPETTVTTADTTSSSAADEPAQVTVPTSLVYALTAAELDAAGVPSVVRFVPHTLVPEDAIIQISPQPGAPIPTGEPVFMTVSTGAASNTYLFSAGGGSLVVSSGFNDPLISLNEDGTVSGPPIDFLTETMAKLFDEPPDLLLQPGFGDVAAQYLALVNGEIDALLNSTVRFDGPLPLFEVLYSIDGVTQVLLVQDEGFARELQLNADRVAVEALG